MTKEYQKRRYDERIAIARARLGGKCRKCGRADDLHFHHVEAKLANVTTIANWSLSRFLTEVDKCILLCKNCHLKIEHGREDVEFVCANCGVKFIRKPRQIKKVTVIPPCCSRSCSATYQRSVGR